MNQTRTQRAASVTPLRRRRGPAPPPPRPFGIERTGGRMWVNGRELGGAGRFEHLHVPGG